MTLDPTLAASLDPTPGLPAGPKPTLPAGSLSVSRAFTCRCGRPVFFRNSICLACNAPLGYDAQRLLLIPLMAAEAEGEWYEAPPDDVLLAGQPPPPQASAGALVTAYRRCANLDAAPACNWLLSGQADEGQSLCCCCRLTRTTPDLSVVDHALWWQRFELAKRRLASSLIGLRLPLASKVSEDPERGLAFDFLRSPPEGPAVITGHADGVITLDIEEADDARREQRRHALHEPYRTLLGHLRHESGHYYWQRLIEGSTWIESWRALFGDERQDYAAALQKHYDSGPAADWAEHFVSAYASSHPWEDWAETWAHYLHMLDTLGTAASFGLHATGVEPYQQPFTGDLLADAARSPEAPEFLALVNRWISLSSVLNELSRSMGLNDFYPFVLSAPAVRKLHFVHRLITAPAPLPTTVADVITADFPEVVATPLAPVVPAPTAPAGPAPAPPLPRPGRRPAQVPAQVPAQMPVPLAEMPAQAKSPGPAPRTRRRKAPAGS